MAVLMRVFMGVSDAIVRVFVGVSVLVRVAVLMGMFALAIHFAHLVDDLPLPNRGLLSTDHCFSIRQRALAV